ncbi:alpha/beta hydrolase family protein [Virgibacillus oceani]
MKKIIILIIVLIVLAGCNNENNGEEETVQEKLTGEWNGSIEIPNQPLPIIIEFEHENELTGTISIPVQELHNYPLSTIDLKENNELLFMMEMQGDYITFDGEVEGETISGTFKQHGQTFPFQLNKGETIVADGEEEGDFLQVETGQGTLYGELETPEGDGTFPVVIIIPGSGPTDRDGNSPGFPGENDSLKLLAEGLADNGIASLRYDKRGAGKNVQALVAEEEMRFDQFVADAVSWVELLNEDDAYTNVGIIGHSQGSLTGMLASQDSEVDAFVSIAGAGNSIDEVLYNQLSEELTGELLEESEHILEQWKDGNEVENVSQELHSVFRPSVQAFTSSWMQYDPAEEVGMVEIPTLIVNGDNDLQVSAREAERLSEAKPDADFLLIEGMNHILKEAPEDREGNLETYSDPNLPLAEGLIGGLIEFLHDNNFVE